MKVTMNIKTIRLANPSVLGRTLFLTLGISFFFATLPAHSQGPSTSAPPAVMRTQKLADGIYTFSFPDLGDFYVEGNCTVVINERDVLVFDTQFLPSSSQKVLEEIRKLTDKPVRFVVNSHWHPDHWSGNEVYAEAFPDLDIIASRETRDFMKATGNGFANLWPGFITQTEKRVSDERRTGKTADGKTLAEKDLKEEEEALSLDRKFIEESIHVHRTLPTIAYENQLTFYHGGREFQFFSLVGDALGTTVMYLPKEKILVTGDVLVHPFPYATPPISQRIDTLKKLLGLDLAMIVPGHGEVDHDNSSLLLLLHFFETIHDQVRKLLEQGVVSVEDVQAAVKVEEFRAQFTGNDKSLNDDFDRTVKALAKTAYREGRDQHEWKN